MPRACSTPNMSSQLSLSLKIRPPIGKSQVGISVIWPPDTDLMLVWHKVRFWDSVSPRSGILSYSSTKLLTFRIDRGRPTTKRSIEIILATALGREYYRIRARKWWNCWEFFQNFRILGSTGDLSLKLLEFSKILTFTFSKNTFSRSKNKKIQNVFCFVKIDA